MKKTTRPLTPTLRFPEFSGAWEEKSLNDVSTYVDYRGKGPIKSSSGAFLVTAKNIKKGHIDYNTSKEYIPNNTYDLVMRKGKPKVGDIVFTTEAPLGNIALIDDPKIALAQRVIKFRVTRELSNQYLLQYMLCQKYQALIHRMAFGTTVLGISGKELRKTEICYPSFEEQKKIASFLTSADKKINQLTKKKKLLEEYKKGVMQKIFSQQIRFRDDNGSGHPDWEETKLDKYLAESRIVGSTGEQAKKITVKLWGKGVLEKKESTLGSANTKYYVRKVGQLIYSKLDFLNCAFGIIPQSLDEYESTLDLPCFDINMTYINSDFLLSYIKQKRFYKRYGDIADGSRKAKRIHPSTFLNMPFLLPLLPEQQKIASFIINIDKKITKNDNMLKQVTKFKKGLLQQMFV